MYGAVPPLGVNVCEYGTPTVGVGAVVGEMVSVGAFTVSDTIAVPLYGPAPVDESVAFTAMLKVPAAVGVPERTPVLESVMPAGSVLTVEYVYGAVPPLAEKLCV